VVATLGPGDGFGELALLYNAPRAATVTTITPCTLWIMERQSYVSLRREHEKRAAYLRKKAADGAKVFSTIVPEHRAVLAELLEVVTFKPGQVLGARLPRTKYSSSSSSSSNNNNNNNKRKHPYQNIRTSVGATNKAAAADGKSSTSKNQGNETGDTTTTTITTTTKPSDDDVVYLIKSGNAVPQSSFSDTTTASYGAGDCIYSHRLTSTQESGSISTNHSSPVVASTDMTCYALRIKAIQDIFQVPFPFQALLRYPYLANIPELSALSENQLLQLASCMLEMRYSSDERVFSKGDVGDAFFVVMEGMFHVTDENEEEDDTISTTTISSSTTGGDKVTRKRKKLLAECGPGKCFGELALLRRQPRAATVTAIMEDSVALMCKKEAFEAHLGSLQEIQLMWRVEALRKVPILGILGHKQRSRVAKLMEQHEVVVLKDGDMLVNKGDRLTMLYLVERGELMANNPDIPNDVSNIIINNNNKKVGATHKKMPAGAHFGDKTLIKKEGDNDTSTGGGGGKKKPIQSAVNIHSVGPCTVSLLSKEMLVDALGAEQYDKFVVQAQQLLSQIAATKRADAAASAVMAMATATGNQKKMIIPSTMEGAPVSMTTHDDSALSSSLAAAAAAAAKNYMSISREYDFEEIGHLGSGAYGHVSLVRDRKAGTLHALKVLNKAQIISAGLVQHAKRERALMCEVATSPFILNLRDAYQDSQNLYYLLEPIYGGDLFTFVQNMDVQMTEKDVMFYVGCVVLGLEHLHSKNIAWRDLKPENLLIDSNGYLKLADFGFARRLSDFILSKSFTLCGTPEYLAPELVKNIGHNAACDWWALGILTYELAAGKPPFRSDDRIEMFRSICDVEYKFPKHFSPVCITLFFFSICLRVHVHAHNFSVVVPS
jgi:cGMP-dependent protein kinase